MNLLELFEEVLRKKHDVAPAVVERRKVNGEDIQAVVKVLAELAFFHELFKIPAGRCDEPDVDFDLLVAADAREGAFLDEAEKFDLNRLAEVADFIKEERSAVCGFGASAAGADRSGECALFVSEKLALDEVVGEGGAVDADEGLVAPFALLLDCAGNEFFSGSGSAADEDGCIAGGDLGDLSVDCAHGAAGSDDADGAHIAAELFTQTQVFRLEFFALFVFLEACGNGFRGDVGDGFEQLQVAVKINAFRDFVVDGECPDDFLHVDDRDADECDVFRVFASLGFAEELVVFRNIGNDAGKPGGSHFPGDAFADFVGSALHFFLGESVGGFDEKSVAMHQSEGSAQESHFAVQNIQNGFEQIRDVALVNNCFADAVQDGNFKIVFVHGLSLPPERLKKHNKNVTYSKKAFFQA